LFVPGSKSFSVLEFSPSLDDSLKKVDDPKHGVEEKINTLKVENAEGQAGKE
jgi:hypothetical protein